MNTNNFSLRHIGNHDETITEMLSVIGKNSIEELIEATLPNTIRLGKTLDLPDALSEFEATNHLAELAAQNTKVKNYLGYGYYLSLIHI